LKTIHSDQPVPAKIEHASLFLAGPTPRKDRPIESWRPNALITLEKLKFDGIVFIPEHTDSKSAIEYTAQIEWEWAALHGAGVIVFWVPRDLHFFPAFTTNVEFGYYIDKKPTVHGRPVTAPKNTYLDWLYDKVTGKKPFDTLVDTLSAAIELSRILNPS